jgi:tRNA-splicing ligase RtcB (3'-phosphate/5'-hydroxy nucleic acid ligase)
VRKKIRIFAKNIDSIEKEALDQFHSAMGQDFAIQGALMPDAHKGYSLPIGAVVATRNRILPSWVGYDIGCGMCALKTGYSTSQVKKQSEKVYKEIYLRIPTGFNHNKSNSHWHYKDLPHSEALVSIFHANGLKQLCSLGSGNHFIEIGFDEDSQVWIIVHSGSRGIGHAVATHYMKLASGDGKAREGHFGFKVDSRNGKNYIADMNFCLAFALENRKQMINRVMRILSNIIPGQIPENSTFDNLINRNHNHAEHKNGLWIHRKGATQAEKGMKGIIPGNMRDGSFIVEGLGNPESLWSSSHGAGRTMGRRKAKKKLSMDQFRNTMSGIKAKVTTTTLDESPFAYKNIYEIMEQQISMVQILHHVKPLINIKA